MKKKWNKNDAICEIYLWKSFPELIMTRFFASSSRTQNNNVYFWNYKLIFIYIYSPPKNKWEIKFSIIIYLSWYRNCFKLFFCSNCFSLSLFSLTRTRFDKYTHSYTKSKSEGEKHKLTRYDDAMLYSMCL